ncbi:Uncharacterized protein SCF082_LOCUS50863, partial [Durusdinium trenchii]
MRCLVLLGLAAAQSATLDQATEPDPSPRLLPSAASYRLAVLAGRCDEEAGSQQLVQAIYGTEHVYVICAHPSQRSLLDDWIRRQRYPNVFIMTDFQREGKQYEDLRLETVKLLLEHSWRQLIDLDSGKAIKALDQLQMPLIARWFAALNGSSFTDSKSQTMALSRRHVEEAIARWERKEMQKLWKSKASWLGFWREFLSQELCSLQVQAVLPSILEQSKAKKRSPATWALLSPSAAFDAGVKFQVLSADWMKTYETLSFWLLHSLLVEGHQHRLTELQRLQRRSRRPRWALRLEQFMAQVTFSPENGTCAIRGAVQGLQLTDCIIESEFFFIERLFIIDPFPIRTRQSGRPASFPFIFRIGSGWDGDRFAFTGFPSLVPSSATDDLWMVLLPLIQAESQACHWWTGLLETRWEDEDGIVHFRGGGELKEAVPIWERYLGSQLTAGTYTVKVLVQGVLLAMRHFEVLPDDIGSMSPAQRLTRFPQYFELAETGSSEKPFEIKAESSNVEERPPVPRLAKKGSSHVPKFDDRQWLQKDVEDAWGSARRSRSSKRTAKGEEGRWAKEIEWIRADVARGRAAWERLAPLKAKKIEGKGLKTEGPVKARRAEVKARKKADTFAETEKTLEEVEGDVAPRARTVAHSRRAEPRAEPARRSLPSESAKVLVEPRGPPWPPNEMQQREREWMAKE